jgi:hypothetical protein
MKEIKIALYHAYRSPYAKWDDKIIAWWTFGPYSHAELVLETDGQLMQCSSSPRDGNVRCKQHRIDHKAWDYIPIQVTDEQYKRIIDFYKSIEGDRYDWFGILGFILPTKDRQDLWFCSETVSNALKINGFEKFWKIESSRVSPNDLARIFGLIESNKKPRLLTFYKNVIKGQY